MCQALGLWPLECFPPLASYNHHCMVLSYVLCGCSFLGGRMPNTALAGNVAYS